MRRNWLVFMLALTLGAGAAGALAQPADQPSRGTTDTTRAIGTEDDGPDLGWIGLVGLAGLLGLRGRSVDRTPESYSTRQTNPAR